MNLFKSREKEILKRISDLEDALDESKVEMRNYISEIKHPNGHILNIYRGSFFETSTYQGYIYYRHGKKYVVSLVNLPKCVKYIARTDGDTIYLKLQLVDTTVGNYLIKTGNTDLIKINSEIVDVEINKDEWIEL